MESTWEESFELKRIAAWFADSEHPLSMPPASVLCDGTHPIDGMLTTILLAPSP